MKKPSSQANPAAMKAWHQMKKLLDHEMPVDSNNKGSKQNFLSLLLLLLINGCGVYTMVSYTWLLNKKSEAMEISRLVNNAHKLSLSTPPVLQPPLAEAEAAKGRIAIVQDNHKADISAVLVPKHADAMEQPQYKSSAKTRITKKDIVAESSLVYQPKGNAEDPSSAAGNDASKSSDRGEQDKARSAADSLISSISEVASADVKNKIDPIINPEGKTLAGQVNTPAKENSATNAATARVKIKTFRSLHFGLEWSVSLPINNNTLLKEVNANSRPLMILIPSVWISKGISRKSSIQFSLNPYAQYLLNSRSALQLSDYTIGAVSENNINQPPSMTQLAQTFTLYKVMGVEASLHYKWKLSKAWSVACGIGNMWASSALLNETIVKNKSEVIKDTLYGVVNTDRDWRYVKHTFLSGKINAGYSFRQYEAGVAVTKPFTGVYDAAVSNRSPLNLQLFLKWRIK